jgi:hypothetical protein
MSFSCQFEGCSEEFQASRPDSVHVLSSIDKSIRKKVVPRTYKCSAGHDNVLYWYNHYDE